MIDPLSALAILKTALAAGKQITSLSKEISNFFAASDEAKAHHSKKKNSIFRSADEAAMESFMLQQASLDAENELREIITQTRGFSQYQLLLSMRREMRQEQKEKARLSKLAAEERMQTVLTGIAILMFIMVLVGGCFAYLYWLGWL